MRNWNSLFYIYATKQRKVESLPMRNWNVGQKKGFYFDDLGWEPTYEELKLSSSGHTNTHTPELRAYLWGIETWRRWLVATCHFGWEPTYEELKQPIEKKT